MPRVRVRVPNGEEYNEYIGERMVWGEYRPFGIHPHDRRQHVYCLGKSGTGKTTLLRNLLIQDIVAGRGVGLIDVHGDLAQELLDYIPPHRTDDVVYFRPGDESHPMGINLLDGVTPDKRHLITSGVVGAFKSIWRQSWGVRMEYVLSAAVASLLEAPSTTLLGVQRIFADASYRQWVIRQVQDPVVRTFWLQEFGSWSPQLRAEIISPIQNKVGQLLMTPLMRNVLGQVKRKIDFRFMMDRQRIFIANLSKGELGEDKANLLGSLLIAGMEHAAIGRVDIPECKRTPFSLFVDEFQNFQTDSFANILSEARKYGLSLVLSHQFARQLEEEISNAVFGNVGTIIAFRVGFADAERLAYEFGGELPANVFADLPNHHICARILKDGEIIQPFQGRTLPAQGRFYGRSANLIRRSRERFSIARSVVEGKQMKWFRSSIH